MASLSGKPHHQHPLRGPSGFIPSSFFIWLLPVARALAVTSNVAAFLNFHYHERHVVVLWLAICKVGHLSQDALNDFI
jgi:hypothetical protein